MQPLNSGDEVVLEVEDAQVAAELVDQLDALYALLVQRDLLQRLQAAVVVFGTPNEQLLRNWCHSTAQSCSQQGGEGGCGICRVTVVVDQ